MNAAPVAAFSSDVDEFVSFGSADEFASVDAGGKLQTLTTTAGDSTEPMTASGGISLPRLDEIVHDHVEHLADVLQGFLLSCRPR